MKSVIDRTTPPLPWSVGDNIPWNDPQFSKRMLAEHLSQTSDAASRRFEVINQHVNWIHNRVLKVNSGKILDLGCGPGFYLQRLAALGHKGFGVDYSPASIEYARANAEENELPLDYKLGDLRTTEFGSGYDLVMMVYGEFNVFNSVDIRTILHKAYKALKNGGRMLLEPHSFAQMKTVGTEESKWYAFESGLFSESPHLWLEESFWDEESRTSTRRYFIIDAESGATDTFGVTYQAYQSEEYESLIFECGFSDVREFPSLTGEIADGESLLALTAIKKK